MLPRISRGWGGVGWIQGKVLVLPGLADDIRFFMHEIFVVETVKARPKRGGGRGVLIPR